MTVERNNSWGRKRATYDNQTQDAFTLIELLVCIGIIAVLLGILLPALAAARSSTKMVVELAASRQLGQAYVGYALDRDGALIPGYTKNDPATDGFGNPVSVVAAERYPWRLVAYIDHGLDGSILVNDQKATLKKQTTTTFMWQYLVSIRPSFGLNQFYLGGDLVTPANNGSGLMKNMDEAVSPSRMIVFGSSRLDTGTLGIYDEGFFKITAPTGPPGAWATSFSPTVYAYEWGYVDPRWDGRAVFSHLDGHSETLDTEQMRDMTRWSNRAAEKGDPNWTPSSP